MNSIILKSEALCWLRFVKKMTLVCTEGGPWSSDVIGTTDTSSIEVEVKTSRADLLAEFRNKKSKHAYYQTEGAWCPNFFYFLVPEELSIQALEILSEKMPKAGLLVYRYPTAKAGRRLEVVKRAQRLRSRKPTENFKRQVMLRMGSELCGLHMALDSSREISEVEGLKAAIVDALISGLGLVEWEQEVNDSAQTN